MKDTNENEFLDFIQESLYNTMRLSGGLDVLSILNNKKNRLDKVSAISVVAAMESLDAVYTPPSLKYLTHKDKLQLSLEDWGKTFKETGMAFINWIKKIFRELWEKAKELYKRFRDRNKKTEKELDEVEKKIESIEKVAETLPEDNSEKKPVFDKNFQFQPDSANANIYRENFAKQFYFEDCYGDTRESFNNREIDESIIFVKLELLQHDMSAIPSIIKELFSVPKDEIKSKMKEIDKVMDKVLSDDEARKNHYLSAFSITPEEKKRMLENMLGGEVSKTTSRRDNANVFNSFKDQLKLGKIQDLTADYDSFTISFQPIVRSRGGISISFNGMEVVINSGQPINNDENPGSDKLRFDNYLKHTAELVKRLRILCASLKDLEDDKYIQEVDDGYQYLIKVITDAYEERQSQFGREKSEDEFFINQMNELRLQYYKNTAYKLYCKSTGLLTLRSQLISQCYDFIDLCKVFIEWKTDLCYKFNTQNNN